MALFLSDLSSVCEARNLKPADANGNPSSLCRDLSAVAKLYLNAFGQVCPIPTAFYRWVHPKLVLASSRRVSARNGIKPSACTLCSHLSSAEASRLSAVAYRSRSEIGRDTEFKLTCWVKDTFSQDDFLGQFAVDMKGIASTAVQRSHTVRSATHRRI